jgi:hypothetical protein
MGRHRSSTNFGTTSRTSEDLLDTGLRLADSQIDKALTTGQILVTGDAREDTDNLDSAGHGDYFRIPW